MQKLFSLLLLGTILFSLALSVSAGNSGSPTDKTCKLNGNNAVDVDDVFLDCTFKVDFIIASGGTAGAAAARVLIDEGYSVLVLEPGENRNNDPNVISSFGYDVLNRQKYSTYEAPLKSTADTALGKTYDVAIARMFGGSMNHNGQMYVKPSLQYLQELEQLGGSDWSVASVKQAFKDLEKYNRAGPIDPLRGTNGALDVRRGVDGPQSGPGSLAYFIANVSAAASGLPITPDYNGANGYGPFPRFDLTQKPNFDRSGTSFAYFPSSFMNENGTPVNSNNKFRVLFHSTVVRVLFDNNKKATGVEYLRNGRTHIAYAVKEVALAGSLYSSKILQHSGVGPASLLQSFGIDVVVDNPHVGAHAANHPAVVVSFKSDDNLLPSTPAADPFALYTGGFFLPHWDAVGPVNTSELQFPRQFQGLWLGPYFPTGDLQLYIIQTRTKSEGYARIQSADPLDSLLYSDEFYTVPSDLDDMARFLYFGIQGTLAPALQAANPLVVPKWTPWASLNEVKGFISANASFNYHYTGTNRISKTASTGVVDPRGRVWGVKRLRVLDSSIVPSNVDGNTAAIAAVVGRRIAQKMAQDN